MRYKSLYATLPGAVMAALLMVVASPASGKKLLDTTFDAGNFAPGAAIDNPYWPLSPGSGFAYYSESADGCEVNLVEVMSSYKEDFPPPYESVKALEVRERAWLDEGCTGHYELVEETTDWHAQDRFGNVWYFGEATASYDSADECPSNAGAWQAGVDGAEAGIVMLANPKSGVAYRQEFSAGNAEDMGKVLRLNASVSIGLGTYAGCLVTKEWSPLAPGAIEHKYYCPVGGGLMFVEELKGKTVHVELIGNALPAGEFASTGVCR
jgi:hypothetical protein